MDILYSIIQDGDVFQTVGSLKYHPDGIPALSDTNELYYNDDAFTVNLTPLLENGESSNMVTLKSSNKLVVFNLSMYRGKLEGISTISVNDQVICEGIWKNGKRNGHFTEYCNGVIVFDGRYQDGVRTDFCYYRKRLIDTQTNAVFINNSPLLSEVRSFMGLLIRMDFSPSFSIRSLQMINGYGERDGITVNYEGEKLKNMELWSRNYYVYEIKRFWKNKIMCCYNKRGNCLYEGGFSKSTKCWLLADGTGKQYEDGILYYEGSFVMGKRCGRGTLYYKNGRMKYKGEWRDDLPHGRGYVMDANGVLYSEVNCDAGWFAYGLRHYNVFDFAPSSSIFTFLYNSSSNTIYESINYPMFPSTHFDNQQAENNMFNVCFSNCGRMDQLNDFPSTAGSQFNTLNSQLANPSLRMVYLLEIPKAVKCSTHFEVLLNLIDLIISDGCDTTDQSFIIESASKLATVKIGKGCYDSAETFSIVGCPRLRSLHIRGDSFAMCRSFVIDNCPRLETVVVEDSSHASFGKVTNVTWRAFPALRTIDLGNKSFPIASSLCVSSNPLLHAVSLGDGSFNGSGNNQVVFSNLPSLSQLSCSTRCPTLFSNITRLEMKGVPKLRRNGIRFNIGHVFTNVTDASVDDTGDLVNSFAKELSHDIFPLTVSENSRVTGSFYTSLTIQQSTSIYLIALFPYIRSITVGNSCCTDIAFGPYVIQGLPNLQSIMIGEGSYSRVKAALILRNLPKLESVTFQSRAFRDSNGFLLESIPNLQTLVFGDYAFCGLIAILKFLIGTGASTTELAFNSLSKLRTLKLGRDCFSSYSSLTINFLPSLTSLLVKQGAFSSEEGRCSLSVNQCSKLLAITIQSGAFKYGSQFQLSELKMLQSLVFETVTDNSFTQCQSLMIEKLPSVRSLVFPQSFFPNVTDFTCQKMILLESITFQNAFSGCRKTNSSFSITSSYSWDDSQLDLIALKSLAFDSKGQTNCSNFDTIFLDSLKRDVELTITEDALPNLRKFEGNAKQLLDTIIFNTKSFEYEHRLDNAASSLTVPNYTRRLYVNEGSCKTFIVQPNLFSPCILLRFISIGNNSLQASPSLILSSLPQLVRVVIGDSCFCPSSTVNGSFTVRECPRLVSMTVGENSFTHVTTLQLVHLDVLGSLEMGASSFQSCLTLTVSQCEILSMLLFPSESFANVMTVDIVENPSLHTIIFETNSCRGRSPITGRFSVRNCQQLRRLELGEATTTSLTRFSTLHLENTPLLKLSDTDLQRDLFGKLKLELNNCGEMLLLPSIMHPDNESIAVITTNTFDFMPNVETLVLADNSLNDWSVTMLAFSSSSLRSIFFGKNSCVNVSMLSFTKMKNLQSIFIDSGSFSVEVKKKPCSFVCHSCSQLQEIIIESDCFCNYKECSIYKLPKLERLMIGNPEIGEAMFGCTKQLKLMNLPSLTVLVLGSHAFPIAKTLSLVKLPHLDKVIFGNSAFLGDESNIRDYTREGNAKYQNQFEMSDLPSLQTIVLGKWCLYRTGVVKITGTMNDDLEFQYASNALHNVSLYLYHEYYWFYARLRDFSSLYVVSQSISVVCFE